MTAVLNDVVAAQRNGVAAGITSICSAHPLVLRAGVLQALDADGPVLIEATSNQVDQYGGYTGMQPRDFRDLAHGIAADAGLPVDRIVLGGDHLGPNRWRALPAEQAMNHADDLIRAYVHAGFTKIHLDCSYPCAGDPDRLTDDIVAARAARLMRVAEDAATAVGNVTLHYVIGTEVPVPGGAHETIDELVPTTADAAKLTVAEHRRAFTGLGLAAVWPRVVALVVQPGVEFDHLRVIDYNRDKTTALRASIAAEPDLVFEAHSTDYQTVENLTALVEDHWAVLKVGPGLTFALREALFALAAIEEEIVVDGERSDLLQVIEQRMLANPKCWQSYYTGTADEQRLARRYSYSDRVRYYWPDSDITAAQGRLFANLAGRPIPLPLLSQHLPAQYDRVRHGLLPAVAQDLVIDCVRDVLRGYQRACTPHPEGGTWTSTTS